MRSIAMLLSVMAASALAMGAAPPERATVRPHSDVQVRPELRLKCLTEAQIRAKLAREGYRPSRAAPQRTRAGLVFIARHRGKLVRVTVHSCTGKVLAVKPVKPEIKVCKSKTAIVSHLKAHGYPYAKVENFSGPYSQPGTKVYRGQVLEKQGPRWCQVKLTVDCYTGQVLKHHTLLDTCIY